MGDHAGRPIHEELLSIAGIDAAQFEGDDPSTPESVRVQLAPGADADYVGREVRRVLAGHGMRSQLTVPMVAPHEAPPPPEPTPVLSLTEYEEARSEEGGGLRAEPEASEPSAAEPDTEPDGPPVEVDEVLPRPASGAGEVLSIREVGITQRGDRIVLNVVAGDKSIWRDALASDAGVDQALLAAVSELLGVTPVPMLVSVSEADSEGVAVLSVLLYDGRGSRVGSAVRRGERAWAVARAMWSALSEPA